MPTGSDGFATPPCAAAKARPKRTADDEARQRAMLRLDASIDRAIHLVDRLLLARQQDGLQL